MRVGKGLGIGKGVGLAKRVQNISKFCPTHLLSRLRL